MEDRFLSVVMPVYNEKATIEKAIAEVLKLEILKQLIVVDDGSTDGTREALQGRSFGERVKVIRHERNLGKGGALRTGIAGVTGEVVAIQDADLEYDPQELLTLIKPIRDGLADVVYGSRLSGGRAQRVYLFWHKMGNSLLTFLTNLLYNTTLTDMETCYKVFRRDVIQSITIRSNDFAVEPELTAKVFKKGLRVYEAPISYYGRNYLEGKKIRWFHGLGAIWALIKYRFVD